MKKKKGAIGVQHFIAIAILMISVSVILFGVFPKARQAFGAVTEKGACQWSVVVSGITQFGGKQMIPIECKAHRIEITNKNLTDAEPAARRRLEVIWKDDKGKYGGFLTVNGFREPGKPNIPTKKKQKTREFALNQVVAKEMKDCAEKVWKGKLPLFDRWWQIFECGGQPCSTFENFIDSVVPIVGIVRLVAGAREFKRPPNLCIICSRIKFDELQNEFPAPITSLTEWMSVNYPKLGGESYNKIIYDWQTGITGIFKPTYVYSLDQPLAVVFKYIPVHAMADHIPAIASIIPGGQKEDISALYIVPYTQKSIIGERGLECDFILD